MTDEARAWAEYRAWTAGATPGEYERTEARAWERLQRALLPHLDLDDALDAEADLLAPPSDNQ